MRHRMDVGHGKIRSFLRKLGLATAGVGLVLTVIGIGSFFAAFGSYGPPQYFWCAFVGLPLLGLGIGICKFAYMGSMARYVANEVAPVGKDTFNYMAEGTKGAVRDLAAAIGGGLRSDASKEPVQGIRCPNCDAHNDGDANFCDACGAPLKKSRECAECHELNDGDARFCDHCGKELN